MLINIKKTIISLSAIFCLVSFKLYAFESVISLGTGVRYTNQTLTQELIKQYTDPTTSRIGTSKFSRDLHNDSYSPELNIEYQARFENVYVGIALNNTNPVFQSSFNNTKINLRGHYTDISSSFVGTIFKRKNYNINLGFGLIAGYFEVNKKNTDSIFNPKNSKQIYLGTRFLVEGEYNINKHFNIFSRLSVNPLSLLKSVLYNSNLEKNEDHFTNIFINNNFQDIPATVIKNTIESQDANSISLNFGIRYKF